MTIESVLSLILIFIVSYLVTQGAKAIAARWKVDLSGYVPNVIAGATALIMYFMPQIVAFLPAEIQTIITLVVMAAMGVTGGAGVHSTIARLSPTEKPVEALPATARPAPTETANSR